MKSRILRLFRLALTVPLALPIVLVIRAIRPFLLVRIGALKSDRIGHFVIETELLLQEQRKQSRTVSSRSLDLYYVPKPVANRQIELMWSRVVTILPRWLMVPVYRFNALLPASKAHTVRTASGGAFDIHNLLDETKPLLWFSRDELIAGSKLLDDLRVEPEKYVCVIARDSSYYRKALPDLNLSYHDYRNCKIETYLNGLEALADSGLSVLRMGSVVESRLVSANDKIIDYANSLHQSDFADVFIAANCKFCISDGLGFFALPAAFRRPNAFVNFSPFHMFYSSRTCDIGITKVFADRDSGRIVPLRELVGTGISHLTRSELIESAGLKLIDNSPMEIRDLVLEMNSRVDGTWVSREEDEELQHEFWRMFRKVIGDEGLKIHGEFRARFGATYLREHVDWFAE